MAGGERARPRKAQVTGTVCPVPGLFIALDDGKGGVDVADVVPIPDAVEVEVESVQLGAQVEAALGIPAEWRLGTTWAKGSDADSGMPLVGWWWREG